MSIIATYFRDLSRAVATGWDEFWFSPRHPETLGLIRILAGSMIFYTHLVWSLELLGFLGGEGRLSIEFNELFHDSAFAWSYLNAITTGGLLWVLHVLGLIVVALFTLGCYTRITSILTFLITVAYVHRAAGALFGLDQINTMLALYLMLGDCGGAYSLDCRFGFRRRPCRIPAVSTNVATRLIQLHMCVIYLFAGLGKLQGVTWWEGQALWLALANAEYQTIDMTWLGRWPYLINFLTFVTLVWEVSYVALIWPRWTRPIVLALAIPVHLGIAACMGMVTFGTIMLIANLAFVSPALVASVIDRTPVEPG